VAGELALRETLGGLILQSTFCSMPDIGAELFPWLPVRWIGSIKYETCKKLPRLRIPVLVMHSRNDGLIGFHHAEKNFAATNEPKLFWEINGDHNSPVADPKHFTEGIEKFLAMLEADRGRTRTAAPSEAANRR
jgi:pimeloyl-ACP methyl ester carboxylesterase